MRKKAVLIGVAAALVITALITLGVFPPAYAGLESAPKVKLKDIDGNSFKLSEYQGKVVIINFWAVWCPPCKMEIPSLVDLYNRYADRGLMVFGIALDSGENDDIREKAKEYGVCYPVINGDYAIRKDFGGIRAVPTTLIINQDGKIYKTYLGYQEKEVIENELKALFDMSAGAVSSENSQ